LNIIGGADYILFPLTLASQFCAQLNTNSTCAKHGVYEKFGVIIIPPFADGTLGSNRLQYKSSFFLLFVVIFSGEHCYMLPFIAVLY